MILNVDGKQISSDEFFAVLRFYRFNKGEFKKYKNDSVGLYEYICQLIKDFRNEVDYEEEND